MIQNIYTIFDSAAQANLTPFFLPTDAMALRTFTQCVNDPSHAFSQAPNDYVLYKLGEFDNERGTFEIPITPINLALGSMLTTLNSPVDYDIDPSDPNLEAIN